MSYELWIMNFFSFHITNCLMIYYWENNKWYKYSTLTVWITFLVTLNFWVFGSFLYDLSWYYWFLVLVLGIATYYLLKYFQYKYEINNNQLKITTPHKQFDINIKEIENIEEISNISFIYWLWTKTDMITKTIYFLWWSENWIKLSLKDWRTIVVAPKKKEEFLVGISMETN